ncbi:UNKNOWN [Stylonychia lemnae]|uniref:Uncharacterized protein n=1 Tax=Stylonychia lemnae TaxID=5949 RepID=A0A078AXG3_STYLE|nr:UNKNOWN [Stylonychia lemnae]|eukprot:CDW85917.1 UNKNOWN [Stylonychia lemnae]
MGCSKSKIQQDAVVQIKQKSQQQLPIDPPTKPVLPETLNSRDQTPSPNINLSSIKPELKQELEFVDYKSPMNLPKQNDDPHQTLDISEPSLDVPKQNPKFDKSIITFEDQPPSQLQKIKEQPPPIYNDEEMDMALESFKEMPIQIQPVQISEQEKLILQYREQLAALSKVKVVQKPKPQYLEFKFEPEGELYFLQIQYSFHYDAQAKNFVSNLEKKSLKYPLTSKEILIYRLNWQQDKRTQNFQFKLQKKALIPLQKYEQIFNNESIFENSIFKKDEPIRFVVTKDGFLNSIENMRQVVEQQISFKNLKEPPSKNQIDREVRESEENLKTLWIALVSKWVKLSKDDFMIKSKYKVDFGDKDVFEMEFIKDCNPNLIKSEIKQNLLQTEFYQQAVYQTVRKSIGKSIWIADYKKSLKEDDQIGVDSQSDEDSRELLKKELEFLDNMSKLKNPKSKLKMKEPEKEIKYHITNISDTFNTHSFEENLKPLKTSIKNQSLVVYTHRKDEYLTVDVKSDNYLLFFLYEDCEDMLSKSLLVNTLEFLVQCEKEQKQIRELLENSQVPFVDKQ